MGEHPEEGGRVVGEPARALVIAAFVAAAALLAVAASRAIHRAPAPASPRAPA
jgi:hypothetical protein